MTRLIATVLLASPLLLGEVTKIHVVERSDVLGGRAFGAAGAYERIVAKAHFALDVKSPQNVAIRDLKLAPKNAQGQVEFSADLYVLKPRNSAQGNGTLLFEVSNRGGKGMLSRFMYAQSSVDPRSEAEFGDMSLLEQGYTLVWLGWQWDVPAEGQKQLRMDTPVIEGLTGVMRAEFIPVEAAAAMTVSDRNHVAYAATQAEAKLTVRESVLGKRRVISEKQWKWNAERTGIEMAAGFQPGLMYELIYTAENPRLQGAGLAGVRDIVSFFKYTKNGVTLLGDQPRFIKRALGFGISQSGRFLRTLLYYGMNEDESGRKVFDGVWADVAGGGRGSFNHRFAQASRDGYAHFNTLYATDLFPYSDVPQPSPGGNGEDGLLVNLRQSVVPKIFYTNGSFEYWNRCAGLIHTSLAGDVDVPLGPSTRLYFVAGSQHGPGNLPREDKTAQYRTNPNETRPLHRALLAALHEWVRDGKEPPRSKYPTLAEEELAAPGKIKWPKTVGVKLPEYPKQGYWLDFGEDFLVKGIVTNEPPKVEGRFAVLLPQVDGDGIDLGGVRMPVVAAPLGTFTGWNLRAAATGAGRQMTPGLGAFFVFPQAEIVKRYGSKDGYLKKIDAATSALVQQRFLLEGDRGRVAAHASALWDSMEKQGER
jgi:hypothetical protein